MSTFCLENLPDEIILKVLSFLESKEVILCGHMSKRIRTICYDVSLWRKINLYDKVVPCEFLKMILTNGCKYLRVQRAEFKGTLSLNKARIK